MRLLILVFILPVFVYADVYFAKLEPVERYKIKSQVSGKIVQSVISLEGTFVKNAKIIKIDDIQNIKDLEASQKKLRILQDMLKLDIANVKNAKKSYEIKKRNYDKIKNLKTKSNYEKDNQLISLISSKNQYINAKQALLNLKVQIEDLKYKIFILNDTISKKNIYLKNRYLYKLYVKDGDFVAPGTPLMDVDDISKGKLTIYLSYEDMINLDKKILLINGKKSDLKFSKVWKVSDNVNISSYRAELIVPKPKVFSKVVKIELR